MDVSSTSVDPATPTPTPTDEIKKITKTPESGIDEEELWEQAKNNFDKSIWTNFAVREASVLTSLSIILIQILVPIFIIVENYNEVYSPSETGNVRVAVIGGLLLFLLWCIIISDTQRSLDGFDCPGGLINLPRSYFINIGMTATCLVNPLTGVAAFFVLLNASTVLDATLNALALYFINRLDEDGSSAGTVYDLIKSLTRNKGGWKTESSDIAAERFRKLYGPWVANYHLDRCCHFTTFCCLLTSLVSWAASIAFPIAFLVLKLKAN